jgi:prepilin-type N-terminal cleavage/methylation domain-containing protein/prepilin-type processing-associated H-X9-DG protein
LHFLSEVFLAGNHKAAKTIKHFSASVKIPPQNILTASCGASSVIGGGGAGGRFLRGVQSRSGRKGWQSMLMSHHIVPHGARGQSLAGFTMIELLAGIAIIAIMASLLLAGWGSLLGKARGAESTAKLKAISAAYSSFAADKGYIPSMTEHYPSTVGAYSDIAFDHYHRQLGNKSEPAGYGPTIWTDLVPYLDGNPSAAFMSADKNRPAGAASAAWQTQPYMWTDTSFVFRWCVLQNEANVARRALRPTDFAFPSRQIIFHEYRDWTSSKPTAFYDPPPIKPINALYADGHVGLLRNVTAAALNFFNTNLPGAANPLTNLQASWDEY